MSPDSQTDSDPDVTGGSESQLSYQDELEPHLTDDVLDEGYSPPDRAPAVDIPTAAQERAGEGLDRRLAEEEPDVAPDAWREPGTGPGRRSGRLTMDERDGVADSVIADDAGIAGGAASSEEAAMHMVEDDAEE